MIKSYVTGFGRIGEQRELKKVLENFWAKKATKDELEKTASILKKRHWKYQKDAQIDFISSNDFSFYDLVLDTIITLGCIPDRFKGLDGLELYFALARGQKDIKALEMTKWFNTNYHYIVPELNKNTKFKLNSQKIINEYKEAKENGIKTKINLIGPITFLALSKTNDGSCSFELLNDILVVYEELLEEISKLDDEIFVQFDEPIFVTDFGDKIVDKILPVYEKLNSVSKNIKIIFATYFEEALKAVDELVKSSIYGLELDFVYGQKNELALEKIAKTDLTLFAGIIDGRNVWKSDIDERLEFVNKISTIIPKDRLVLGTSCSLLHVPFSLKYEDKLNKDIKSWLSFALEKLEEIAIITKLANNQELNETENKIYQENKNSLKTKSTSTLIHDKNVQQRVKSISKFQREKDFAERIKIQRQILNYGILPTTTIGSFPQTSELRQVRNAYKKGLISKEVYEDDIKDYIDNCIKFQEECGIDVLVHGEPERNDMVEYFGEQLKGYAFSKNGWVQSYGSRCVKPPLLFGDVSRPEPMTVKWITYAQNKTKKIVKGMLTGPVTILNWSFVRNDIPRGEIAKQLALCINDEIADLQNSGIKIIQVDEAAFKEGYPLREVNVAEYEKFAVDCFKLSVSSAKASTQIHTHMCYSEFNDIIKTIEAMDADVISIETTRSGNELLKIFAKVGYKQEVGPGVYDIHSPRIPNTKEILNQIKALLEVLPKERLWINPDCGLKTRKWEEVKPSLINLVKATKLAREL
ncbi:cobalamin-independent homocysteine transmethylase [Campylobacter blaseri]|uniref:5-methyltetrahydropteroyltriglutamate--homocysteine methyltransferase n=1 Tax=Campylobacter blaseri TaxID=2042961 RepID=A0A2P8QZL8_9BACT|nr:5-methyltetrahydropteroyltriglutamate--homocysteine S-methyltransferase [Campylobacter blaseri]PSM51694.1 5-methyltetrahydropteroyltriglutamate--homocysteine S-methyltransferase [Campylobacter blaseri]PSM53484.1 5-methyltetrahydropteroyltriglutamate--homocysteine S-methyltransferase [Campylobacter blaseri]QKF86289.1 cobalamin-independent homocysteine transmethylase [Campylobacter blaseri]